MIFSCDDILNVLKLLFLKTFLRCFCSRFVDQCDMCRKMFVRDSPAPTVGQKLVGGDCQVRFPTIFDFICFFLSFHRQQNPTVEIAEESWEILFWTGRQSCHRRFVFSCQESYLFAHPFAWNCDLFVISKILFFWRFFQCFRTLTCQTRTACKQTWALSWVQLCRCSKKKEFYLN